MTQNLVAAAAGLLGWSLSEYLLHRFAGHGPFRRREGLWFISPKALVILFHEEHTAHHQNPMYFAPTWKKALSALVLVPVMSGLAALLVGREAALVFGLSYAATYVGYEVLHRRIHTHPPLNAYFAWMRRHHLHHHVRPHLNHGVTSPLFDLAFKTYEVASPVSLHFKLAPAWLLDEGGQVRPAYAKDYRLAGR